MKIAISCESTCDLPMEIIKKNDIKVIRLGINLDDKTYVDGVDITTEKLFELVDEKQELPKTSAKGSEEYKEFFEEILKTYDAVIHVGFSSELSCSYQNANIAIRDLKRAYIVDSKNLSSGHGMMVLEAVELVNQGLSPEEIVERLNKVVNKISTSFVINTMKFLFKGGRCTGLQYFGANLLKIKPSIVVEDGKMKLGKKYVGKITECTIKYIDDTLSMANNVSKDRIFLTYSSSRELNIPKIKEHLETKGFKEIIVNTAGCTVSTHCGPDCIGIIFKQDV